MPWDTVPLLSVGNLESWPLRSACQTSSVESLQGRGSNELTGVFAIGNIKY